MAQRFPYALPGIPGFPASYWAGAGAALYLGDVRKCLRRLPARSVHCVVTSPPYWGLRDYGTGTWEGGSANCDHVKHKARGDASDGTGADPSALRAGRTPAGSIQYKGNCAKCGAVRTDSQLGLEEMSDCLGWATGKRCGACYVCHMVEVFAEVRRVLRDDGTVWLNLGSTYRDNGNEQMIPARVALALQADGWVLRQDIIWHSPNKMPESVQNRCTKSHEHIFLLAKGQGYYYDGVAIQEVAKSPGSKSVPLLLGASEDTGKISGYNHSGDDFVTGDMVNKRDVWIVPTTGYPGAHFATFSPRLITPCILAGTSEAGCCAECGIPYERVVAKTKAPVDEIKDNSGRGCRSRDRSFDWSRNGKPGSTLDGEIARRETIGWRKVCGCWTDQVVPCIVLDPFVGSGTTVATALELGRNGVGVDLSEIYLREHAILRIEAALRGEKVGRKVVAPTVPPDVLPAPRRLR